MIARTDIPDIHHHIVESIKHQYGFDFIDYHPNTLRRRTEQRMRALGFGENHFAYTRYLQTSATECATLTKLFWINHTGFFRDSEVWHNLASSWLPALLQAKNSGNPIRVWCAGCATGQEVYSLAILLSELMGRPALMSRVTIYATDVDEDALNKASQAYFSLEQVESGVPRDLIETYFEAASAKIKTSNGLRFRTEKVCPIIFRQHNLLLDPPLEQMDLILCRNVLIYFNPQSWERVLDGFARVLAEDGLLVLGKAESPLLFSNTFTRLDYPNRIFGLKSQAKACSRLVWGHG